MKKLIFLVMLAVVLCLSVLCVAMASAPVNVTGVATAVAPVVSGISTFNPALGSTINNLLLAGILIFQALKYFFPKM